MTVTPFTMQDVVNGVLNQMRYAPGRDVQIHLQSSIVQDASILYRTLMRKYVWRDFINLVQTPIDATTGRPTVNMSPYLDRYSNLAAVYKDNESQPMPFAPALINPSRYNRPCVTPAPTPYIFRIWPAQAINVIVWTKNYRDTDFDLADTVPFYFDLLVVGTAFVLATKSSINQELTKMLEQQFNNMVDLYRDNEIQPQYQVNQNQGAIPMEWYSYDN